MITIKDIAKLANVSQSTVSKALNDRSDVGEATKARIRQLVEEYNFTPNAFGKALKNKYTENIGIIFCREPKPLSTNPFYSRVLEGIEAEIALNGYNLILHILTKSDQVQLPKMIREGQVDGVILVGIFKTEFIDLILEQNLNVVLVDPKVTMQNCSQVLIDNEQGGFLITQYLIERGHRHIGFMSGDLARWSFKLRYDGYKKALNHYGIAFDESLVVTGGIEKGYEHVKTLIENKKITAVFSTNDLNAIYGYKAISEHNLKVPDDISVVGFDDIDMAKYATPPLTTVRVYKEELGSLAVRNLFRAIKAKEKIIETTIVPVKVIERESVRSLI